MAFAHPCTNHAQVRCGSHADCLLWHQSIHEWWLSNVGLPGRLIWSVNSTCIFIYIYIYIYTQGERERETDAISIYLILHRLPSSLDSPGFTKSTLRYMDVNMFILI